MASSDFLRQLQGSALTMAEIHDFLPDCPSLLQLFIWQAYDEAPDFPALRLFLDHWHREIDGALHSVRITHRRDLGPARWRSVDAIRPLRHPALKELLMIYRLHRACSQLEQDVLAEKELPHTAAALDWAQEWLRDKPGAELYSLACTDGNFAADFVRTVWGQWYAIGR